jgi:hypothetical protein
MKEYNIESCYLKRKNNNSNKFQLGEIVRWNTHFESEATFKIVRITNRDHKIYYDIEDAYFGAEMVPEEELEIALDSSTKYRKDDKVWYRADGKDRPCVVEEFFHMSSGETTYELVEDGLYFSQDHILKHFLFVRESDLIENVFPMGETVIYGGDAYKVVGVIVGEDYLRRYSLMSLKGFEKKSVIYDVLEKDMEIYIQNKESENHRRENLTIKLASDLIINIDNTFLPDGRVQCVITTMRTNKEAKANEQAK